MSGIQIEVSPTPNPNALKFITNSTLKQDGKSTFRDPYHVKEIPLAYSLFDLRGVDQIHFFDNMVTITKFSFEPWESLEPKIIETLEKLVPKHDPNFEDPTFKKVNRDDLSPELQQIEEILDRRIRPGLQGDGGDLNCVSFEDNILKIQYLGACGTCPSSTMGTLHAIRGILQDEYDPEIEVYISESNEN